MRLSQKFLWLAALIGAVGLGMVSEARADDPAPSLYTLLTTTPASTSSTPVVTTSPRISPSAPGPSSFFFGRPPMTPGF